MRFSIIVFLTVITKRYSCACDYDKFVTVQMYYNDGVENQDMRGCTISGDNEVNKVKFISCLDNIKENTFENLGQLVKIIMENVCIKEIAEKFFTDTPNLREISLKSNQIKIIKRLVFYGTALDLLDLSYNKINTIEPYAFAFMDIANLLNLEHNRLSYLHETWFERSNIKELNMANNKIMRIKTDVFLGVNSLDNLNLMSNNIHIIDDSIGLSSLKSLILKGNWLNELIFLKQMVIDFLDISVNKISYINLEDLEKIKEIVVEPNPWHCSCLFKFWKDRNIYSTIDRVIDPTIVQNASFPICATSGQKDYVCKYHMDENINEVQEYYLKLVNYAEISI